MMDEYPDPDEEYELLYQEEIEAMKEMEEEALKEQYNSKSRKSKNFLNFDSPLEKNKENIFIKATEFNEGVLNAEEKASAGERSKRCLSLESLDDITSDLEVVHHAKKRKSDYSPIKSKTHEHGTTSVRIPKWPFLPICTEIGEKLYVKIRCDSLNDDLFSYAPGHKSNSRLLVTPYSKLKALAEEILKKSKESQLLLDAEDNLPERPDLWVEKYKPKTYFDLLSDEAVNRTLLNWLKMWDRVVFGRDVKSKPGNANDFKLNLINQLDKDGRPHYKIALLCGPPGLGKTTLAHVAAALAGYTVLEVNASDDRTVEALKAKLDAATQIQSVIGNCKPYCLVLDEIDGAPTPTIEFLLKYLSGKIGDKSKKGKKDKPLGIVRRPVICICNELYTPSLRQLRQQAFVVHFPHTSSSKLAQRLLEICRKQNIKTDLSTLTLLCDKAENDIRSCISTLFFFKTKNGARFKSTDVMKSSVGQKDIQKGMFSMWKEIFQIPLRRGKFFSNLISNKEEEVSASINYSKKGMEKLQYIVQLFQSTGDHDRLVQGVFENFPKSKFSGSADSLAVALQWFTWFDIIDFSIKKEQNFILLPYLSYAFAAWHCLFSSNNFWKISYPSVGYENHLKETRCGQILSDVLRGLSAPVRAFNPRDPVLLDVLPMLALVLVPPVRSVNPTLFSDAEKKDFQQLIDVMIEYGLNFVQQRSQDGTYSYQYDPNIEELSRFNVASPLTTRSFSYNMRQIISHEVELERLRRAEENLSPVPGGVAAAEEKKENSSDKKSAKEEGVKEEVQFKDFFGRVVTVRSSAGAAAGPRGAAASGDEERHPVRSPIWFCFKEGYNNAVKKDVTMADLL